MQNIYDLTLNELEEYFVSIDEKPFRASQVYEGLYKKRFNNFEKMTNISKELREKLSKEFSLYKIKILIKQTGDNVNKYLFELEDGNKIESVLMFHNYGISICISSQVGCNMACAFCESGRLKKVRNLLAYEMVEQLLLIEEDINKRITHVVIMGIGEPFDNYENVMKFIKIINSNKGINIGSRHITVSTCGLIPEIRRFAKEDGQVNLAISLHAPNNEIRNKLMKINKVYRVEDLIEEVKDYIKKTNRRVTFEYILLEGINDSEKEARELVDLLKGINCYVNLIPYNETDNIGFKRTKEWKILKFYNIKPEELHYEKEKFAVTCGIFGMEKIMDSISSGESPAKSVSKFVHGIAYNAWNFCKKPEKIYLSGGFCENKCLVDSLNNYCEVVPLGRFVLCEGLIKE